MKMQFTRGLVAVPLMAAFLFAAGCSSVKETSSSDKGRITSLEDLEQKIDARFSDPLFANAHWGVMIQSLKTGKVWYERNSERMFNPASNNKILSASAALTRLGPDFTFETDLCLSGIVGDSVLNGDVVVFGNGDPTLYNHFQKDPRDLFFSWARMLRAKGIRHITGNVIGDDNAFDDNSLGEGWSFDGLDAWYSAEVGPLQLNENYVDLSIIPPATKFEPARIEPNLPSNYYTIVNNLTVTDTGRSHVYVSRPFGTNKFIVQGNVVAGSRPLMESPAITNPTLFYVTVLKEVFQQSGIQVDGLPEDCDDIPGWKHTAGDFLVLDRHQSPKLSDVLKEMMKRSQNMYAEIMPRALSWKFTGKGSFRAGKKIVEDVLKEFGIQPNTYAYVDGSGLTRYDYVSPKQLVTILTKMKRSPYWKVWYDAQPIAGIDGTLRSRMKGTKAEGNVHAKTGTISNVRGLSGYVKTADGEDLVFSFLVNGYLCSSKETENITDSVLEMIASLDRNN
ncbi:MAG TPA: D-alanyl-D-alanine carboxypeptidase/D-alanyl-D-alanine-endopeptidase [Ignavibacteriales bacterium]|nr:D-alanyl-D-alanine carboxypeptidase/D-alanyl-D-alanine-endopeptidase [Ignavibacteriales bacterium]